MGVVMSSDDPENKIRKQLSKRIDDELLSDKKKQSQIIKLLLLGTAECGKSTILKQMKILHNNGFSENEVSMQKSTVYKNTVSAMSKILLAMKTLSIGFGDPIREVDARTVLESAKLEKEQNFTLSLEVTAAIKKLWQDKGVQNCFSRGSEYQLYDSAKYFFDNIDRISAKDFIPTEQDILRARITTTGINEVRFEMRETTFRVFDVGGQRSERRKWIHCFDDVNSVIFIVSLSEYNMVLTEDGKTNRTHESLLLYETIVNCAFFTKTAMILFLNKTDLFAEKIKEFPLTIAFPEYKDAQNYECCVSYMREKFVNVRHDKQKHIYVHETCATDTESIKFVFDACFDVIFVANMKRMGLV